MTNGIDHHQGKGTQADKPAIQAKAANAPKQAKPKTADTAKKQSQ